MTRRPAQTPRIPTPVLQIVSFLVAGAAIYFGTRALLLDLQLAFRSAPRSVLLDEFRKQVDIARRIVPEGASVIHISVHPESWYARLWQRALYPRNPVIVLQPPDLSAARLRELRKRHAVRYAISAGDPPMDPGYRWREAIGRVPGLTDETWIGELAP